MAFQKGACLCVPVKLTNKGAEKVFEMIYPEENAALKAAHTAYLESREKLP